MAVRVALAWAIGRTGRLRAGLSAAAGLSLWLMGVPLAASADIVLPEGECRACYALLVDASPEPDRGGLAQRAGALERRGFRVSTLERPAAHSLWYHADRLFRRDGAAPGAHLVFWFTGPVEGEGAAVLLRAGRDGGGPGVGGLDLRAALRMARESAAASALLVIDTEIPGADALPISPDAAALEGGPRLLVTRGGPGGPVPLGPVIERLMAQPGELAAGPVLGALATLSRAGVLLEEGAVIARAETAAAARFEMLPPVGGSHRLDVPEATALRGLGLEAPARGQGTAGSACDRLAAYPEDPSAQAVAVPDDRLDAAAAAEACRAAMFSSPATARFAGQYARALKALGRDAEAVDWALKAADLGHPPSQLLAAEILIADRADPAGQRRGIGLLERAAEALFGPAVRRFADVAAIGNGRFADLPKALALLRRMARAGDGQAALRLADMLAAQDPLEEAQATEALAYYRQAAQAGIVAGRRGADAMQARLDALRMAGIAAECGALLDFDVMAIESFVQLAPGEDARALKQRRLGRMLESVDLGEVNRRCGAFALDPAVTPDVLARYGYLLYRSGEATLPSGDTWIDLVIRGAIGGDPVAQYLQGWARMGQAYKTKDRGRAEDAVESYEAACRGGIDQACFWAARMQLGPEWSSVPGFRQAPREGVRLLEQIAARAPRARQTLIEVYEGTGQFTHLQGLRDPMRARQLSYQ